MKTLRKRDIIYKFIDKQLSDADYSENDSWASVVLNGRVVIGFYPKYKSWFLFKGEYPMIFIEEESENSFISYFILAFGEQNIPYIFDWVKDRFNVNLPEVKTYLYGTKNILDAKVGAGIYGNI